MTCIRTIALTGVTFVLLMGSVPVKAAEDLGPEIEQRLDTIMKTEEGVDKASVRIEVAPKGAINQNSIDFSDLDLNKDGIFARDEVGEKLFTIFDRDGNGVIDNIEMKRISLKVRAPMEKTTIETIDYRTPGKEQTTRISHEEFLKESKLARFDKEKDGLSPLDFLEMSFYQVNVNRTDGVIDLYEWKRAYAESVKPMHMESFIYNN